jgi:serine protease inhibitor
VSVLFLSIAVALFAQWPARTVPDTARFRRLSVERFALDQWHRLSSKSENENLLFSPLSLSLALSLAYAGATGGTADAFAETLGISQATRETYDTVAGSWIRYARTQKSVELSIANSLWASQSVPMLPEYRARMQSLYGAELERVNLSSRRSVELINAWVSRETRGKIPTLLEKPPLEHDSGMVLLNALYFKGKWTLPFDSSGTKPRPFHLLNGKTVQRASMQQTARFGYLKGDRYRGLRLPYGDGRFAMYVLLPDSGVAVDQIKALQDSAAWVSGITRYGITEVNLVLPKFTVRSSLDLNKSLKAAGLAVAFDSVRAEFYRLVPAHVGGDRYLAWIRQVLQKTMMEVSEQGTEAAATTAVIMEAVPTSAEPPPLDFVVDRPFAIVLRDERSGSLLFIGRIEDPR